MNIVLFFFSTVTPGQFPTCCLEPVSTLKSVVLPQFGFPTTPTVKSLIIKASLSIEWLLHLYAALTKIRATLFQPDHPSVQIE